MNHFAESTVEEAALGWFAGLGYAVLHGPDIAPGEPCAERASYAEVVLAGRLRAALARLNPSIPASALEEAARRVLHPDSANMVENNRRFHTYLSDGVPVEYQREDGTIAGDTAKLIDPTWPERNDWLVVNQFTIEETANHQRRPDVVVFVNGLPLAVLELKNPADAGATIKGAYNQFQTYKQDIPALFHYNEILVVSDGTEARAGTLTSGWEWFSAWKTIDGATLAPAGMAQLEVLIRGMFEPRRLLDLLRHFVVFAADGATGATGAVVSKKLAAYHQYHAVSRAIACTLRATSEAGDKRVGVVWHTQGSGKSLSMAFYAGKVIAHPEMANPTVVVITDRDDLDDQLFGTFAACWALLRQTPVQAQSRKHLRELLQVASGGVIFTTIQKFAPDKGEPYPLLTARRNVVLIADEAHRSQYGFGPRLAKNKEGTEAAIGYGFAKYVRDGLPNASFIAFTGTPVELSDKNTRAVFGDYIDTYDVRRAVEDHATVPIYYEARLARLALDERERPRIEGEFDEVTEGEEESAREKLKSKWARLEAMVGAEKRIALLAQDVVAHFEARREALEGKGMIVCMSRRICVELYDAIVALRPAWHGDADEAGALKVVMTGSAADPPAYYPHVRNKARREALANRFKDPADPFALVIVRDMWLTGFDAPSLHTMYVDKPMRGHGLMQAIARVNRVFRDKEGGLIVDYLGLGYELKEALRHYTADDRHETAVPQERAVAIMREKLEVVRAMLHGFDYDPFFHGTPAQRVNVIPAAMEHILARDPKAGKKRLLDAVTALSRAFALAVPDDAALAVRDEIGFFQALRAALVKVTVEGAAARDRDDLDTAVRQIVSRAITSPEIVDVFAAAGIDAPDASILSDAFLAEVRGLPYKNVALEALRRLLNDEIAARGARNVAQTRGFAEKLEQAILRYQNRALTAAEVIDELIAIAREMRAAAQRGEALGLSDDELAFYDALGANDSAVQALGDETLKGIARDLVATVRANATIDWTLKETVRAKLRAMVRRLLARYGYPPDRREEAVRLVLEQAEAAGAEWAP